MRIVIIGGTGHVGTYLVPRLVLEGHEVISVSRNLGKPYQPHKAWDSVRKVHIDRNEAEQKGDFGKQIRDLNPEVVIDMICFSPESARHLANELDGKIKQFLHCGTIWVHGHSTIVPTEETQTRKPFGDYGIQKADIESYLLEHSRNTGFPVTILHPGHIVGSGWTPVNPAGNFNLEVFRKLANGRVLELPNIGMETLHHVHADDVAQAFICAINNHDAAIGEDFHIVSPQAITLRGYAESMAEYFDQKANLKFLPWEAWKKTVNEADAEATWDHIAHSPNCSIDKARHLLDFKPGYNSIEAVQEAVEWLDLNHNLLE